MEEKQQQYVAVLLDEYKQLYEYARHDDRVGLNKENLFVALSYGILAYTVAREFDHWGLIGAGLSSIVLYLWHVFSSERMQFLSETRFARLREIEAEVNAVVGIRALRFSIDQSEYRRKTVSDRAKLRGKWSLYNPYNWLLILAERRGIRPMRMVLTLLLLVLWIIRFVTNEPPRARSPFQYADERSIHVSRLEIGQCCPGEAQLLQLLGL